MPHHNGYGPPGFYTSHRGNWYGPYKDPREAWEKGHTVFMKTLNDDFVCLVDPMGERYPNVSSPDDRSYWRGELERLHGWIREHPDFAGQPGGQY